MPSSKNEVYDFFSPPSSIRAIMPCRRTTKLQRQILARYPSNHRLSGCSNNHKQSNNENEEIEKFFTGYNDEEDDAVLFTRLEEVEEFEDDNDDDTCLVLQSSFEAVLVEDDRDIHVMPSTRKENLSFGCSVSTCSITSYSDDTISIGSNTTTTNTNTNTTNLSGRVFVVEEELMEKQKDCMPNNDRRHRRNKKQTNTTISPGTTIKLRASRTRLKRQLSSKFLQRNKQLNSYKSREVQDFFTTAGIEIVLVEGEEEEEEEEEEVSHSLPSSPSLSSSLSSNIGRCRKHRHKVIDDDDDKQKTVVGNGLSYDTYYVRSNTMVTGQ